MNTSERVQSRPRVRQLVLQPTPFCNIDCRYCYLASRNDRRRMSPEVLRAACRRVFQSPFLGSTIDVIWHAGEPLVLPISYFENAFAIVRNEAPQECRVDHSIQTNGLMINDRWCDFFLKHRVRLGLSIDGPAWLHDRHRVTRSGQGTHEQLMKAVGLLNRREVPFQVIAVLTPDALCRPDEIYQFFAGLGARSVGFNIEETEGNHRSKTLEEPDLIGMYGRFMKRMFELRDSSRLRIREVEAARLGVLRASEQVQSAEANPLEIVSVDVDGHLATFSPELLGIEVENLGAIRFGNVLHHELSEMLEHPRYQAVAEEIARGVELCRTTCEYFTVCGGGAPANKLFENGSFATTETRHCQTKIQVNTRLALDDLEARSVEKPPIRRHAEVWFEYRGDGFAEAAEAAEASILNQPVVTTGQSSGGKLAPLTTLERGATP